MTIEELKKALPLPELLRAMGLGAYAKRSCCSPLRKDRNPSWGIYEDAKGWHWKDHGTGEGGDELDFLQAFHKCDRATALAKWEALAGVPVAAAAATVSIGPVPDEEEWRGAVERLAENPEALGELARWRGYSKTLLCGLIEHGLVGLQEGAIAFPIRNEGGAFQGMHLRGEKGWRITGGGNQPWFIGRHDAENVHLFESQWDALAFMDSHGFGNGQWKPATHACLVTRGAGNARKLEGRLHAGQTIYIWPQNDEAGAKWAAAVAEMAAGEVFTVSVPPGMKDANEWLKSAGREALREALKQAKRMEPQAEAKGEEERPDWLRIRTYAELLAEPQPVPPQVIDGVLYKGGKMVVGGTSKGRKTWSLMDLAAAMASGGKWWGFQVNLGNVLYVNFELQEFLFRQRMEAILKARRLKEADRLHVLNLRGHAADMKVLRPVIEDAIGQQDFDMLIFDPVYKLLGNRSENDAGEMADLMNEFEALAVGSGAATLFAHHFAKGSQAGKFAIDRMSGSGVMSRDPDAIVTLTDHEEDDTYVCETTLRAFPALPAFGLRWAFPQLVPCADVDVDGIRQPGRKRKCSEKQLFDLLPRDGLKPADWLDQARDELGVSRSLYYELVQKLEQSDMVFKHKDGSWQRMAGKF